MRITGGHTAPRDGRFALNVSEKHPLLRFGKGEEKAEGELRPGFKYDVVSGYGPLGVLCVELKAGEKFAGDEAFTYDVHELREGETVPKNGVWFHMSSGKDYSLKEGETFPTIDDGSTNNDFVWTREIA